jgi:hypothetical protein
MAFVVYMGLSRFGKLKLGKDNEKPAFDNMTWFSMLFCSGIGIGLCLHLRPQRQPYKIYHGEYRISSFHADCALIT